MEELLNNLELSVKHLKVLDSIFTIEDYPEKDIYIKLKETLSKADEGFQNRFCEELYVGGKKRNNVSNTGFGRQMILSDVIQYIVNGRGYFFAMRNKESMQAYIKMILNLTNQLMIFDSAVTNPVLRRKILTKLKDELGDVVCKDEERLAEYNALLKYDGYLGFPISAEPEVSEEIRNIIGVSDSGKALKRMELYYDSLFPKPLGLWGEILVYSYLLRMNIGFVFPLLLTQRIITGNTGVFLKPPDFLILPFGKEHFYGIEVGSGKDIQSGNFSIITGMPTATKANADNPKRCCVCGKWMLFCPQSIEDYSNFENKIENIQKPIKCLTECKTYSKEDILSGKCSYAMHKGGQPQDYIMEMKSSTYHFHLNCMLNDKSGKDQIIESKVLTYYPYVSGLEEMEQMQLDKDLIQKQIDELKEYISKSNINSTL